MTFKSGIQEVKLELTKNQDNLEGPLHALTFIIAPFLMKSLADIQCNLIQCQFFMLTVYISVSQRGDLRVYVTFKSHTHLGLQFRHQHQMFQALYFLVHTPQLCLIPDPYWYLSDIHQGLYFHESLPSLTDVCFSQSVI